MERARVEHRTSGTSEPLPRGRETSSFFSVSRHDSPYCTQRSMLCTIVFNAAALIYELLHALATLTTLAVTLFAAVVLLSTYASNTQQYSYPAPKRTPHHCWRTLPDALLEHEVLPGLARADLVSAMVVNHRLCIAGRRVFETTPLRVPQDSPTLHAALAMVKRQREHCGHRPTTAATIQLDAGTFHLPESQIQGCLSEQTSPNTFPNIVICGFKDIRIVGKVDRDPHTNKILTWRTRIVGAVRITGESCRITLEGLHIHSCTRSGIRIQGHSRDILVECCLANGCGRKGVVVREFSNAVVRRCRIVGNKGYAGIFATGDKTRVHVDGCRIVGNKMQGIWCVGGAQVTLSNRNRITHNARYGLRAGFAQLLSSGKIIVHKGGLEMRDNGNGAARIDTPASIHGPGWHCPEG